jgi:hypothetical protein
LIILVFVVVGQTVSLSTQQWWQQSVMLERFERAAIQLQEFVPAIKSQSAQTGEFVNDMSKKAVEQALENVDPAELIEQVQP